MACGQDQCTWRQKLNLLGGCEDCDDYESRNEDGKSCKEVECNDMEYLTKEAVCIRCENYKKPDITGYGCERGTCEDREQLMMNASCNKCPDYTRAQSVESRSGVVQNNAYCAADPCNYNEKVTKLGLCFACPTGQVPSPDG